MSPRGDTVCKLRHIYVEKEPVLGDIGSFQMFFLKVVNNLFQFIWLYRLIHLQQCLYVLVFCVTQDFRNLSYTLPSVRGLVIHMEDRQTSILLPRNRYDQVGESLVNECITHLPSNCTMCHRLLQKCGCKCHVRNFRHGYYLLAWYKPFLRLIENALQVTLHDTGSLLRS